MSYFNAANASNPIVAKVEQMQELIGKAVTDARAHGGDIAAMERLQQLARSIGEGVREQANMAESASRMVSQMLVPEPEDVSVDWVEQRSEARFSVGQQTTIMSDGDEHTVQIADISRSGLRIAGSDLPLRAQACLRWGNGNASDLEVVWSHSEMAGLRRDWRAGPED